VNRGTVQRWSDVPKAHRNHRVERHVEIGVSQITMGFLEPTLDVDQLSLGHV
jgi:hypothetical protein